jgi:hypothetical protein
MRDCVAYNACSVLVEWQNVALSQSIEHAVVTEGYPNRFCGRKLQEFLKILEEVNGVGFLYRACCCSVQHTGCPEDGCILACCGT